MFTEVGRRVHLHSTGVGKALLGDLPDEAVRDIAARAGLPPATDRTITDVDGLLVALAEIRERGYAVDDGEQEIGVRCFAVLVPGAPVPTALSVSGPAARVSFEFGERAVPVLHDVARDVGAELSGG
jgi:IclR family acetate operon transcriptional repressor